MSKTMFVIAAGIVVAMPATAQTIQPQPVQAATAKSDVNKIICKREEQIGSRLGAKKVCLTVQQWEDRAVADREQVERLQRQSGTRPSG